MSFFVWKKGLPNLPSCSSSPLTTETNNAKENPDVICWARHTKRELDWITCPFQVGPTYLVTFTPFTNHVKGTRRNLALCLPPNLIQFIGVLGVPNPFWHVSKQFGTHFGICDSPLSCSPPTSQNSQRAGHRQ